MKKVLVLFLLTIVVAASARTIKTAHGKWKMVWEESFSGNKIPFGWTKIPRFVTPWAKYMSSEDCLYKVKGGKLTLYGRVNDFAPNDTARYLTGGIYTKDHKLFSRGRIEIRLKMDNASGAWPAAWLLPQIGNWPYQGEIDIMERLNYDDYAYQTVHSAFTQYNKTVKNKPKSGWTAPIRKDKYNVYGVELYEDSLCFFINDTYVGTYRRQPELGDEQYPFDRPMYLLIDMQLEGHWVGKAIPAELPYEYKIDYVRFYRKE